MSKAFSETGTIAAAPQIAPRLTLAHVSHFYGRALAVDDVSFSVAPGELVCLVGPSGCGKSTLLRIIAGLLRQSSGQLLIDGQEVAGEGAFVEPEKRGVGLMFQDYALFPHLDVLHNVAFGLSALPRAARTETAMAALAAVGMTKYAQSYPHTLSGGEQQRVALARALAPRPKIMLMDEPFSGLDRRLRDEVREQTLAVLAASGAAAIMVTHDPEEAMLLADRIILMRKGHIVQIGEPEQIYLHPADAETAEFFYSFNRLHGLVRNGRVSTPFGEIAAPGLSEGMGAEILVRPEQMRLEAGDASPDHPGATVVRTMRHGQDRLLELALADGSRMQARLPFARSLPVGTHIILNFDPASALVFPCRCGQEGKPDAHP